MNLNPDYVQYNCVNVDPAENNESNDLQLVATYLCPPDVTRVFRVTFLLLIETHKLLSNARNEGTAPLHKAL